VCSYIKFDKKESIDANSFLNYLKETPAPTKFTSDIFKNKKKSYYTYLSGWETEDLDLNEIPIGAYDIVTDEPYGVIFTYTKHGDLLSVYALKTAAIGAGIGIISASTMKGIPFIGKVIGGKFALAIGALGGSYGALKLWGVPQQIDAAVALIPYDESELQKLDCEIFPVKSN